MKRVEVQAANELIGIAKREVVAAVERPKGDGRSTRALTILIATLGCAVVLSSITAEGQFQRIPDWQEIREQESTCAAEKRELERELTSRDKNRVGSLDRLAAYFLQEAVHFCLEDKIRMKGHIGNLIEHLSRSGDWRPINRLALIVLIEELYSALPSGSYYWALYSALGRFLRDANEGDRLHHLQNWKIRLEETCLGMDVERFSRICEQAFADLLESPYAGPSARRMMAESLSWLSRSFPAVLESDMKAADIQQMQTAERNTTEDDGPSRSDAGASGQSSARSKPLKDEYAFRRYGSMASRHARSQSRAVSVCPSFPIRARPKQYSRILDQYSCILDCKWNIDVHKRLDPRPTEVPQRAWWQPRWWQPSPRSKSLKEARAFRRYPSYTNFHAWRVHLEEGCLADSRSDAEVSRQSSLIGRMWDLLTGGGG